MNEFQLFDKGDHIMVVGLSDCMGDWGEIDMTFDDFMKLPKEERDTLIEKSFI